MENLEMRTVKSLASDGDSWLTKVAFIDKAIGITLTFNDERYPNIIGDESFCLNGPLSQHYKSFCETYPLYDEKYEEMFDMLIEQITLGEINISSFYDIIEEQVTYGVPKCPYK